MVTGRRLTKRQSLKDRLLTEAKNLREKASQLAFGSVRHAALKQARHIEAEAHMDDWINSPGLRPPEGGGNPGPIDTN